MDAFPLLTTSAPTVRCHGIRANGRTCGRWLRDAESVAARMGPDCRERAGLVAPSRPRLRAVRVETAEGPNLMDLINERNEMTATFLSHPSAETLLDRYGNTAEGRQKARDDIAEAIRVEGKRLIEDALRISGRSMKCGAWGGYREPHHAGDLDGCANDGTTCICDCHDPVTA